MTVQNRGDKIVTHASVREYFQDSIADAMHNQRVEAGADTIYYVVNLMTGFTRAEQLYEPTEEGRGLRPLALLYAEALESHSVEERNRALRRLGDVALFIAGVFSDSLNRKLVDVDYYIAMGGNAYGFLSDAVRGTLQGKAFATVFGELSERFTDFVDVLGEVSERTHLSNDVDVLRIYEVYMRTGSKRAQRRLRALGIEPVGSSSAREDH